MLRTTRFHTVVSATLLAVVGTLSACGGDDSNAQEAAVEEIIEQASGGSVDIEIDEDGNVANIETEDGSLNIGSGELPAEWPADVPVYEGGQIMTNQSMESNGERFLIVGYQTTEPAGDAVAGFKSALVAAGFTIEADGATTDGAGAGLWTLTASRGQYIVTASGVGSPDEPTQLQLSLTIKP